MLDVWREVDGERSRKALFPPSGDIGLRCTLHLKFHIISFDEVMTKT